MLRSSLVGRCLTVALFAFGLTLPGCAGTKLGTGRAAFCRADSAHFALYTDQSCETARAHVVALEHWLLALSTLGFGGFGAAHSAPLHLNVVMLSSQREFERYARPGAAGYFVNSILMEPWVVMPEMPVHRAEIIKHELVHSIAFQSIPQQPVWYAEGLAEYLKTAEFNAQGEFAIGRPSRAQFDGVRDYGLLSASEIFRPSPAVRRSYRFYISAWYLVHYLMSNHPARFASYQTSLGKGMRFEEAWQRTFADLTEEAIDEALHDYFFTGQYARFRHPVARDPLVAVTTRTLPAADEHALQGILWLSGCRNCDPGEARARANESFRAALQADPMQLQAAVNKLGYFDERVAVPSLDEARGLAQHHPEAWQAWVTYAFVANAAGKLDDALKDPDPIRELERLAPYHPYTWITKAHRYEHSTLREHALRSAQTALRLGPQSTMVLSHAIKIYANLKACRELEEAISALRQLENMELAVSAQAELRGLLERCDSRPMTGAGAVPGLQPAP